MPRKNRSINNPEILHTLDPQLIVHDFTQRARPDQMVLRADMVLDILDPLFLRVQTGVWWRQFALVQRFGQRRVSRDAVHPCHTGGQDLGIDFVAEIAWVDLRRCQGVGRFDVYCATGQGVLETHQQGDLLSALGWRREELRLVRAFGDVEPGSDAKSLEICELGVS